MTSSETQGSQLRHDTDAERFCGDVWPALVRTLTVLVADRGVAEELAQETLVRVVERWDHVRSLDSPDAWCHRVATNLARSWWRRRGAERRARERLDRRPDQQAPDAVVGDRDLLERLTLELDDRERAVLALRHVADLSVTDVAAILDVAPGTVTSIQSRLAARLGRQAPWSVASDTTSRPVAAGAAEVLDGIPRRTSAAGRDGAGGRA